MCLAIPVRVVELRGDATALVDLDGIRKEISLALVDDVRVGDYVILHVGYALSKLDPEEAARTLALFADVLECVDDPEFGEGAGWNLGVQRALALGARHVAMVNDDENVSVGAMNSKVRPSKVPRG